MMNVNLLAVLFGAIGSMVVGFVWYGPLFGKSWAKLMGFSEKETQDMKKGMGKTYGIMFVASFIMAYILSQFVGITGTYTLMNGMTIGFWAWLGFVATVMMTGMLFGKKSLQLYFIDSGYQLANLVIMGAIVGSLGR